jgi:hypothetical protein
MPSTRAQINRRIQNSHSGYTHHDTPTKARVQGACDYAEATGQKGYHKRIFEQFGVSKSRGWEILRQGSHIRRSGHNTDDVEARGRPPLISLEDLRKMERIIEDCDAEGRSMSWDTLAYEAGLDVSTRTIRRAMGTLDYHKCIACRKGWVNKETAKRRVEYATLMLDRYPYQKDWHHVRFSDEVHFGLGPQGKLRIIRKPGERYCINCIQHEREPEEPDKKKIHAWAAVGHRFKSPLVFYDISSNTNGKMTQRAYIDMILEPVVKPWLKDRKSFILEEDQDSGHGTSQVNIVRTWKQQNGLQSYFNCSSSPDLALIENVWQPMKQYIRKYSHWHAEETRQLAYEGWDSIPQAFIDKKVNSMPQRLRDIIQSKGHMTGW